MWITQSHQASAGMCHVSTHHVTAGLIWLSDLLFAAGVKALPRATLECSATSACLLSAPFLPLSPSGLSSLALPLALGAESSATRCSLGSNATQSTPGWPKDVNIPGAGNIDSPFTQCCCSLSPLASQLSTNAAFIRRTSPIVQVGHQR